MIINKCNWMIKFIIVVLMLTGCTQKSRTAQSVISIHSQDAEIRNEVRMLVESLSKKENVSPFFTTTPTTLT